MNGLYIHIPFCHSKCYYCDFYSSPNKRIDRNAYATAVIDEYNRNKHRFNDAFDTVYIGGGTPSTLSLSLLERLINSVKTTDLKEFTIEVNPEDVTAEFITGLQQLPITRISMGVQSLVDEELKGVGRRHDAQTALRAMDLIASSGLTYSFDLIYGLPGQSVESMMFSLNGLLNYNPHHLSAYILSYEPGTRLSVMLDKGIVNQADDDLIEEMYASLIKTMSDQGYDHYEISNFCKPEFQAVHNSKYWTFTPYLGLGASAHSYDGQKRWSNVSNTTEYIAGATPIIENETREDRINDYIVTSLRTRSGMSLGQLSEIAECENVVTQITDSAQSMIENGSLIKTSTHLRIPEKHWLVSDAIMRRLIL